MINNPDSKNVHRLIKKNRAHPEFSNINNKDTNGDGIVKQEKKTEIFVQISTKLQLQRNILTRSMEECEFRYNLINSIVHQSIINRNEITQFTEKQTKKHQ